MTVRAQAMPEHSRFPAHAHPWAQMVYATSGTLSVVLDTRSFVISPEQAAWLPPGVKHQVGSMLGADFKSLWIAADVVCPTMHRPIVFQVSPLLRALVIEAAALDEANERGEYSDRVTRLILDQLVRVHPLPYSLPWPTSEPLMRLCEAVYADPSDPRTLVSWSNTLNMSLRTLSRRFEAESGMSFRSWQRRLRLFRAVEILQGESDVTQIALTLGYASASAFIYAFRQEFGVSPKGFARTRAPR
jgi:AraC-like DNA-binding protein